MEVRGSYGRSKGNIKVLGSYGIHSRGGGLCKEGQKRGLVRLS